MGQENEPVVEKDSVSGSNDYLQFGCSGMQGYMDRMKDSNSCDTCVKFPENSPASKYKPEGFSFFSVITGGGGEDYSAKFCDRYLQKYVTLVEERRLGQSKMGKTKMFSIDSFLVQAFRKFDENLSKFCLQIAKKERGLDVVEKFQSQDPNTAPKEETKPNDQKGGSTEEAEQKKVGPPTSFCIATSAILNSSPSKENVELVCCQIGNNKCVVNDRDDTVEMTVNHNPQSSLLEKDDRRIKNTEGCTIESGKILGLYSSCRMLGLSTAVEFLPDEGRREIILEAIIPDPSIKRYEFKVMKKSGKEEKKKYQFIVVGTRGVWDVMKNEEVCEFIKQRLVKQEEEGKKTTFDLVSICNELLDECVLKRKSKPHSATVCIIKLASLKKEEESEEEEEEVEEVEDVEEEVEEEEQQQQSTPKKKKMTKKRQPVEEEEADDDEEQEEEYSEEEEEEEREESDEREEEREESDESSDETQQPQQPRRIIRKKKPPVQASRRRDKPKPKPQPQQRQQERRQQRQPQREQRQPQREQEQQRGRKFPQQNNVNKKRNNVPPPTKKKNVVRQATTIRPTTTSNRITKKKKKKVLRNVVVEWSFRSDDENEMSVKEGERLIVHMDDGKWLYCQKGQRHGFVPTNHVKFID